ncbi:ABC transporter ATP-binding protein [Bacteroidales bacterium OttesenSCG-928-C19]|nr:ABC transporter ATP-binding protein [Bacteroidales bacterium OttesenSCG-928-C19]
MVKVEDLKKSYGQLMVLKGINLHVAKEEIVSIVGASGAGKTTLLQILGSLDRPDSGKVIIDGENICEMNSNQLASFRNRKIGFVFQFHHLLPEFTALENVCIPAFIAGRNKKETEKEAKELLGFLGLNNRESHKPQELSGGEQQRVAVARALINKPAIILADEPSGNLDSVNAKELHNLFFNLRKEYKQTFIIVTHNKELSEMSDRTIIMEDGLNKE